MQQEAGDRYEATLARLREFRDRRNWSQYHNPKDLTVAISIEASELLKVFLWSGPASKMSMEQHEEARLEMADILIYLLYLADRLNIDLWKAVDDKICINDQRF